MKILLLLKNVDDGSTREVFLDRLPILLGRSRICDVVLQDAVLSRQHCQLELGDDSNLKLVDLESANGTFVQGKRISETKLTTGQNFQVGSTEIKLLKLDFDESEEATAEEIMLEEPITLSKPSAKTDIKTIEKQSPSKAQKPAPSTPAPTPPKAPAQKPPSGDLSMKTPVYLRGTKGAVFHRSKDWVQVSVLWKDDLLDIQCFDQGRVVTIGSRAGNDFVINYPQLPETFNLLKILKTGVEVNLHPSMTGVIETRKSVQSIDEARKSARQTELGLATFVEFQDRCLIEMGPFSVFIQSVRLNLTETLSAPLVREPFFASVLASVTFALVLFLFFVGGLTPTPAEDKKEEQAAIEVKLNQDPVVVKRDPPPPPPAPKPVKKDVKAAPKIKTSGTEGAGAKAQGDEGKAGRKEGRVPTRARAIGMVTKKQPAPIRTPPKGASGDVQDPNQAKRGLIPDQGVGTGTPQKKTGGQLASEKPKKQVRIEDVGLGGVLGGAGGGGKASAGGAVQGTGLGGELEGSLEGLERGSDIDSRGSGGRGLRGAGTGGGGTSLEVGGLATQGKAGGKSGFGLGSSGKKGEAEVSFSSEEVQVLDGLTREEIERVVRAHQSEVEACYEKALIQSGNPSLSGRLKMGWFVNSNGRAENINLVAGLNDGGYLFQCVSQRIRTWQFPRPRGGRGAQVSWPWVFRRGN